MSRSRIDLRKMVEKSEENLKILNHIVKHDLEVQVSEHIVDFLDYPSFKTMALGKKRILMNNSQIFELKFIASKFEVV